MEKNQEDEVNSAKLPLQQPPVSNEGEEPVLEENEDDRRLSVQYFEFHKEEASSTLECSNKTHQEIKTGWRRYAGLVFALFCSLFFSLTVLLAKILQSHNIHPYVITMWRYGGILVPSIPIAIYFQNFTEVQVFETLCPITKKGNWKNLLAYLMQGILGCTATIFRFISLKHIPIADSTVVFSAYTVFVTILAHFCLGEKCGVFSVIFAFTTAIGVIVISRPPIITGESEFNFVFLKGVTYAILALLCTGTFLILMRKIRKTHFALMMLVGGTWGVFESGLLAVMLGKFTWPATTTDWGLIAALMGLTFLGQTCFVLAVKYENAGPLSIARTSESIYAFLWQYIFLGVVPDFISVIGGFLVISAVICTGYCKYLASLPIDNYARRKFGFLLK